MWIFVRECVAYNRTPLPSALVAKAVARILLCFSVIARDAKVPDITGDADELIVGSQPTDVRDVRMRLQTSYHRGKA
jgi:hypothetical protein